MRGRDRRGATRGNRRGSRKFCGKDPPLPLPVRPGRPPNNHPPPPSYFIIAHQRLLIQHGNAGAVPAFSRPQPVGTARDHVAVAWSRGEGRGALIVLKPPGTSPESDRHVRFQGEYAGRIRKSVQAPRRGGSYIQDGWRLDVPNGNRRPPAFRDAWAFIEADICPHGPE